MACPICGGETRSKIAPGLWRCETVRHETWLEAVPRPVGPRGEVAHVQEQRERSFLCQAEYAERDSTDPTTAACQCGIYSIGLCVECGVPLCGEHGDRTLKQFRCKPCAEVERERLFAQRAEADESQREAEKQDQEDARASFSEWEFTLLQMAEDTRDELEQVLINTVLRHPRGAPTGWSPGWGNIPEIGNIGHSFPAHEVALRFADLANRKEISPSGEPAKRTVYVPKKFGTGVKQIRINIRSWHFPSGSTGLVHRSSDPYQAYVGEDGSYCLQRDQWKLRGQRTPLYSDDPGQRKPTLLNQLPRDLGDLAAPNFNEAALYGMAEVLGIASVAPDIPNIAGGPLTIPDGITDEKLG